MARKRLAVGPAAPFAGQGSCVPEGPGTPPPEPAFSEIGLLAFHTDASKAHFCDPSGNSQNGCNDSDSCVCRRIAWPTLWAFPAWKRCFGTTHGCVDLRSACPAVLMMPPISFKN